jgi:hypothetical protein
LKRQLVASFEKAPHPCTTFNKFAVGLVKCWGVVVKPEKCVASSVKPGAQQQNHDFAPKYPFRNVGKKIYNPTEEYNFDEVHDTSQYLALMTKIHFLKHGLDESFCTKAKKQLVADWKCWL